MKNKTNILVISVFTLVIVSMACGGGSNLPAISTATPIVFVQATEQALTASAPLSTTVPLTFAPLLYYSDKTPIPTSTPVESLSAIPIYFANRATSAFLSDTIAAGQVIAYSLYVIGDQPAQMALVSENKDATLAIYDPSGKELLAPGLKSNSWKGYFNAQGIYIVKAYGGAATSTFTLAIGIAARATFAPAATETRLIGRTVKGRIISYAVSAAKGQKMEVTINTDPEVVALTIWGFTDNQTYASADAGTISFSTQIPATQDYIIDVVPRDGEAVTYSLFISLK
jgi:hypothetical protein